MNTVIFKERPEYISKMELWDIKELPIPKLNDNQKRFIEETFNGVSYLYYIQFFLLDDFFNLGVDDKKWFRFYCKKMADYDRKVNRELIDKLSDLAFKHYYFYIHCCSFGKLNGKNCYETPMFKYFYELFLSKHFDRDKAYKLIEELSNFLSENQEVLNKRLKLIKHTKGLRTKLFYETATVETGIKKYSRLYIFKKIVDEYCNLCKID